MLGGNHFAKLEAGIPLQIAVPVGTPLTIDVPTARNQPVTGNEVGAIEFKNNFCTLSIRTQFSSSMAGVGQLQPMVKLTDEQNQRLQTANYSVKINVVFDRTRSGHPKMPLYKSWAIGIANGLKKQFDEELIWAGVREDYLFQRQIDQANTAH